MIPGVRPDEEAPSPQGCPLSSSGGLAPSEDEIVSGEEESSPTPVVQASVGPATEAVHAGLPDKELECIQIASTDIAPEGFTNQSGPTSVKEPGVAREPVKVGSSVSPIQCVPLLESTADQAAREEPTQVSREAILRPQHRGVLPPLGEVANKTELAVTGFLTDHMSKIHVEGHKLFRKVREWHLGAEILQGQVSGYYLANHDEYHNLAPRDTPCRGYGNWILW